MQQFSVTYKNMIPTWCTRQSPIIPLIYGWWTVLQETAVLVKQAQFDGCPFSERLWGLKPNVWHHWFGPRSFQLGSREVRWGESPEESSSCLAIFKAPGRVRGHMHSVVVVVGGISWRRQMSGKTLNWLRAAQSTSLLYFDQQLRAFKNYN